MTMAKIEIPIDKIAKGIKIAKDSISQQMEINEKVRELGTQTEEEVRELAGFAGVQKRKEELAKAQAECDAIAKQAQEKLEKLHAEAVEFVKEQTDPVGDDISGENEGDFALFAANLIISPEKLERLLDKHPNSSFYVAADRYASDPTREWPGFTYISLESNIIKYLDQVFEGLSNASAKPTGFHALQYTQQQDEFARIAKAYGISDEFYISGGEKLETLFIR